MSSETAIRLQLLKGLYAIHDAFCATFQLACGKGCRLCCTANVTLTSLEARLIAAKWHADSSGTPLQALTETDRRRFQPRLTINRIAELCLQDQEIPEEAAEPLAGSCPLLRGDDCSIYTVRPFACRAMVSRCTCLPGGEADMPEPLLAANNVLMQYIEALDNGGGFGNLADMLLIICTTEADQVDSAVRSAVNDGKLAANRSIPALMVPPECREALKQLMAEIQRLFQGLQ